MADETMDDTGRNNTPSIVTVDRTVAVLTERLSSLKGQFDSVEKKLDTALALFATKEDVKTLAERIAKVEGQISWGVKIVIGLVLSAVIGGVIISGHH